MAKQRQTVMQQAIAKLFAIESGSGLATPEQMLAVAAEFDVEVMPLESFYLDAVDALAES
jgi:hypothetical protein